MTEASSHASDSAAQRAAEPFILDALAKRLAVTLEKKRVSLPGGSHVDLDGASADEQVLVEIYARQGALKAAQVKKVATDVLKLIVLKQHRPEARCVLAFASEEAAQTVRGKKWLAEAVRDFAISVEVVELPADIRQAVIVAQTRQIMVNAE